MRIALIRVIAKDLPLRGSYGTCYLAFDLVSTALSLGTPEKRKVDGSTPSLATTDPLTFSQVSGFFRDQDRFAESLLNTAVDRG
jgi:hypothetical protein